MGAFLLFKGLIWTHPTRDWNILNFTIIAMIVEPSSQTLKSGDGSPREFVQCEWYTRSHKKIAVF